MAQDKTYNGWSNYATWRINLEIFDGFETQDYYDNYKNNPYEFGQFLKDYTEEIVFMDIPKDRMCSLVSDYAGAFLDEVHWYEIAEHLLDAEKENIKYYEDNQNEVA
jgi:hypothetical protein